MIVAYVTETYKGNPEYVDHGTREYCSYDGHLVSIDFISNNISERVNAKDVTNVNNNVRVWTPSHVLAGLALF